MNEERFQMVGIRPLPENAPEPKKRWVREFPYCSAAILSLIVLGCLFAGLISAKDPSYMDLTHCAQAPDGDFLFGTDTLGRDIFSMISHGGRISLIIGFLSAAISALIAVVFGSVSGLAPGWADSVMMRFTEILLSIPNLLIVIFLQAMLGKASALSISLVLGVTGWTGIAKVVRTQVRALRASEYVLASRCMGAGFFHILRKHLTPNFISSIMFMVVMNIRSAIVAESTLSFMGIGLSLEQISWGSMLSLAERALMTNAWWIILIPGIFLITTLVCVTNIGNYLRKSVSRAQSNL